MKKILLLISFMLGTSSALVAQESAPETDAAKLWEQAITAKGGRERLHAVRNLLITNSGSYKALQLRLQPGHKVRSGTLKSSGLYREELFVFPDKYWSWVDYRPAVFGLWIHVYDYTRNVKSVITDGEPNHPAEPIEEKEMKTRPLLFVELMYLLESNWVAPKPLSVTGESAVYVVHTEVDSQRFDFAIDRKTKLVTRFTSYSADRGQTYVHVVKFSDYENVGGIMMPHVIVMEDGHKEYSDIKTNVGYDESIFIRPPSIDAGPHAWMKANGL